MKKNNFRYWTLISSIALFPMLNLQASEPVFQTSDAIEAPKKTRDFGTFHADIFDFLSASEFEQAILSQSIEINIDAKDFLAQLAYQSRSDLSAAGPTYQDFSVAFGVPVYRDDHTMIGLLLEVGKHNDLSSDTFGYGPRLYYISKPTDDTSAEVTLSIREIPAHQMQRIQGMFRVLATRNFLGSNIPLEIATQGHGFIGKDSKNVHPDLRSSFMTSLMMVLGSESSYFHIKVGPSFGVLGEQGYFGIRIQAGLQKF